jgi:hypothetical protein
MIAFLRLILDVVMLPFKTKARMEAEIIMLRHQLNVLRRHVPPKPRLAVADRLLFVWLYRLFPSVLDAVTIVQPQTVIRWHRTGFRLYWRWKSRSRGGRPKISGETRRLIREMSLANRLWGAPRIHGELLKLGIEVAQSTVAKYMARGGRGRSQTWKTFLHNHSAGIGAMDFLLVPTVGFRLLFVLVILRHERRLLISLSVTANPTAEWIARRITDAFPWGEAPDYLIRDRDASYGQAVTKRLTAMGIRDHPTAARAPWRACGETDRLDPQGVPRSYRCLRRGPFAANSCGLRQLLQQMPNAPVPGQRFAEPSADPAPRPGRCSADPRWTSSSILPDVALGRDRRSRSVLQPWASVITRRVHSPPGRTGMRRDCLVRSAGNASITSSSSARPTCAGSSQPTPAIATESERICP